MAERADAVSLGNLQSDTVPGLFGKVIRTIRVGKSTLSQCSTHALKQTPFVAACAFAFST